MAIYDFEYTTLIERIEHLEQTVSKLEYEVVESNNLLYELMNTIELRCNNEE